MSAGLAKGLSRHWPLFVGIIAIAVAVAIHIPSLDQPLLEAHSFRQTQTAYTALIFHESGIDLLHPKLPVFGAPWELPFEFPLFQALASLVMDAGVAPDVSMRATSLAAFALTALLVWRLTIRLAGEVAGLVALVAFLLSPLTLLWSRASLMEYLATAAAMGYVYSALRWHQRSRGRWFVAALITGVMALLVKITTGLIYLLPVMAMPIAFGWIRRGEWRRRAPYLFGVALLVVVPLGVGVLWTQHADSIKSASEFTRGQTSEGLASWNFGTLAQKLNLHEWLAFINRWNELEYGWAIWLWTPLALLGAFATRLRIVSLSLVVSAWLGPVAFTNLYFVHDYYLAAVTPLVAIGVGLAGGWLWERRRTWSSRSIAALLAVLWVASMIASRDYWMVQFRGVVDFEHALVAAETIAASSEPSEPVVVTGREWSPAALYYARRWGLMFPGPPDSSLSEALAPEMVSKLKNLGYSTVFHCPWKSPDGCTAIIDLNDVPADLDVAGVSQAVPDFMVERPAETGSVCYMDALNGQRWEGVTPDVGDAGSIAIEGWAFDEQKRELARATYVRLQALDGGVHFARASRVDRPDVGEFFGNSDLSEAGFAATFSSESLPAGVYDVAVVMETEEGAIVCESDRRFRR